MPEAWRRCSSCKKDIGFSQTYWVCNVSTCNAKRTGLAFCSVDCWDQHLGFVNHRESWAVEKQSPATAEAGSKAPKPSTSKPAASAPAAPRRVIARAPSDAPAGAAAPDADLPREILIVASKLKQYIRARSGMSTSDRVLEPLSDAVRKLADRAIANARRAERKTVLDRDID